MRGAAGWVVCVCLLAANAAGESTGAEETPAAAVADEATPLAADRLDAVLAGIQARQHRGASGPAHADAAPALARPDSLWRLLYRLLLSLFVVLGLLYVVLRLLRRNLTLAGRHAPDRVRVVSRTALSTRSCLYVVEVVGRTLLVGESQGGGVRLICDLGQSREEIEAEAGRQALDEVFSDRSLGERPLSFAQELKQCLRFLRGAGRRPGQEE